LLDELSQTLNNPQELETSDLFDGIPGCQDEEFCEQVAQQHTERTVSKTSSGNEKIQIILSDIFEG